MKEAAPIGRELELEELARLLGRNRVVCLTGAPGVGKSAVAAALSAQRPSALCGLYGIRDADGVCRELARTLGLPGSATSTAPESALRLGRAIAGLGRILVVLDDADLARAALGRLVSTWLTAAPAARFVIAARAQLDIPQAQRFDLGPLEVPKAHERDREAIQASAAVRLFVRCASAVRPGYRLSPEAAPHVAAIVRTLAGLPLAIQLCASRVVVLGERELAETLADRLDALDADSAAAGGRTLRGAFALSWDQLAPSDARVLAACATFRDSFDLDGAAAVTGESRLAAADALVRLEQASLLHAFEPESLPGARRYALPSSVRVFAVDRLSPEARDQASRRHAEHYAALAERSPKRPPEVLALDREDLEAALAWANEGGHLAVAARVALTLAPLALSRGPLGPYLERVDALLASPAGLTRDLGAELHLVRGLARLHHGRRDEALSDLARALELATPPRDLRVAVTARSKTGLIVGLKGDFVQARAHLQAARELLTGSRDPALKGMVEKDLANVLAEEGRNADAVVALSRARDLFHLAGDVREEGFVLMMLGTRLLDDGQLGDARRDCNAGLELLRAAGDHRSAAWTQVVLGLADGEDGDLRAARTRLDGALLAFRSIGDVHTEGLVLGYLGNVALEQGASDEADDLYRDARARLAEAGDTASEGLFTATAGVVEVSLGRIAAGRERFLRARALVRDDGRAARRLAVDVLASVLEAEPAPSGGGGGEGAPEAEEVRFARRAVAAVRARRRPPATAEGGAPEGRVLVVAADGSWLRTPAARVARFGAGGALRGIVRHLAQERVRYPGRAITVGALVRAGWPGEAILPAAAKNRLHVTITRLRRAGLADILVRSEDGYLLDPAVEARVAEADDSPD